MTCVDKIKERKAITIILTFSLNNDLISHPLCLSLNPPLPFLVSSTRYVNDAFGTAHRAHASTEGVTKFLSPSVAGFLLQKELDYLDGAVSEPKRPFCAIVGGSKVSSKIGVIESLLANVDKLILGGGWWIAIVCLVFPPLVFFPS